MSRRNESGFLLNCIAMLAVGGAIITLVTGEVVHWFVLLAAWIVLSMLGSALRRFG